MALRIPTPLSDDVEELVGQVIAGCISVHRELGPGLLESVYHRALMIELDSRGISHDAERVVPILFKGQPVSHHRLDLVVDDRVVVEVKAVDRLGPIHVAQVISYLKTSKLRVGLLVNFNVCVLKNGIRRIVC